MGFRTPIRLDLVTPKNFESAYNAGMQVITIPTSNLFGWGDRWSYPTVHPTDGRIAFQVKDRVREFLPPAYLTRIEELTSDWFPVVN